MRIALAALVFDLLQGCSFLFVRPPPDLEEMGAARIEHVDCTTSRAAPIIDTVIAASYGLSVLGALSVANDTNLTTDEREYAAGYALGAGLGLALFGWSSRYGWTRTSRCATAQILAQQNLMHARDRAGCGSDSECKGDRVCDAGMCVEPPAARAPALNRPEFPGGSKP